MTLLPPPSLHRHRLQMLEHRPRADSVWERANIDRAERFLELAGRLERRQGNPRIVRIKPIGEDPQ